MSPGEALAFLFQRARRKDTDPEERTAAERLARELGYLPLALEQAAAYIKFNALFQDYLKEYEPLRLQLLDEQGPVAGDYPEAVHTTWTKSFEAVKSKSAAAADLLTVSAFLAPDRIPYEILVKGAPHLGETLAAALANAPNDARGLNKLLTLLTRYSLIRRNIESRTYDIHRLVQAVIRDGMDELTRGLWAERTVRAVDEATPPIEFDNWPDCDRLLPHWMLVPTRSNSLGWCSRRP